VWFMVTSYDLDVALMTSDCDVVSHANQLSATYVGIPSTKVRIFSGNFRLLNSLPFPCMGFGRWLSLTASHSELSMLEAS